MEHEFEKQTQNKEESAGLGNVTGFAPPVFQLQASSLNPPPPTGDEDFPYEGVINTEGTGFHKEARVATDIQTDYIRPDFTNGEQVTVLGKTPQNWLKVSRVLNGKTVIGYVDFRYVDRKSAQEEPVGEIELDAVTIERLSKAGIQERAEEIRKLMSRKAFSLNPAKIDWVISDMDVATALIQLQAYYDTLDISDFGSICIALKESGHLQRLFRQLNDEHLVSFYSILVKLSVFMPQKELINIGQRLLVEEGMEEGTKMAGRKIFRYPSKDNWSPIDGDGIRDVMRKPTEDNWNPIDTDKIKSDAKDEMMHRVEELLANQDQVMAEIDANVEAMMQLKTFEIRHYMETKNYPELRKQLIEVDQLADAALELLFAEEPSNPLLTRSILAPVMPLWEKYKSEKGTASVYLDRFGSENKISNFYNHETGELVDPNAPKTPENVGSDQSAGQQTTPAEDPGVSAGAKTFFKELIVREAEYMHQFFYTELVQLGQEFPEMVGLINQVLENDLKPAAEQRLSEGVEIDGGTTAQNISSGSLDSMNWMDIVRVWYYELGEKDLGSSRENPLVFSGKAKTTQELMNSSSGQQVIGWANARVKAGDYSEFQAFIHYNVNGFYKAVASRDIMFNFMGSFTVKIEPDKEKGIIKFEAYNKSGMESASRFRRKENAGKGEVNKIGVFEDVNRKDGDRPGIGGDLHAKWTWQIPIQ